MKTLKYEDELIEDKFQILNKIRKDNNNGQDTSKSLAKYESSNLQISSCKIVPGSSINYDAHQNIDVILNPNYPLSCLELCDSDNWIKKYGLKTNKLTFENILATIGFKQTQDYLNQFKRNISSKYSQGLFLQTQAKNGMIYNITVGEDKLIEIATRLEQVIKLYQLRLQWLNTSSRRLFGVMIEPSICIVLDCKQKDKTKFLQFRNCILKLLREQVSKLLSFNIIRCSDHIETFKDKAVVVSAQSIEEAIDWINDWDQSAFSNYSDTISSEAVMLAFQDRTIESIYLISEGTSSNGSREILFDKLVKESNEKKIRLNVVSFDCVDISTVEYLKRLACNSYGHGRFHAYCLLRQYDDFIPGPINPDPTKSQVFKNKRTFGGAPPGAGVKNDLMIIFEEIQIAKETLENLKSLIESMSRANGSNKTALNSNISNEVNKKMRSKDEEYMTSKEWLQKHGLKSRKLDIFDILNEVCFRHCDGVVDLKKEPLTGKLFFVGEGVRYYQGDSVPRSKLINAKYCDQFAHVLWNDGTILHVHVTPDLHRSYEEKIKIELEKYEKRIDWLSKGSRELFGTVIESNICILIDTSQSMQMSLDFVKRKLAVLMNEQLKSKQRFNLISFNTKIYPWRDRMVEVDEFNTSSALEWINNLNAQGTTNTLGAIRFALSDLNTEAIYLLSDGRPDQEARQILSQVHLNTKIPIHTISFNCNDSEANKFLSQLARETNGRYHYFNEDGWDADPNGPIPYQSEDTHLLKLEIEKGLKYLTQIAALRDECAKLTNKGSIELAKFNNTKADTTEKNDLRFLSKYGSKLMFNASKSSDFDKKSVLSSLHDIQSLDWILPETRQLLERQFRNQIMRPHIKPVEKDKINLNITKKIKKSTYRIPDREINNNLFSSSKIKSWLEKNRVLSILDALLDTKHLDNDENNIFNDSLLESKPIKDILDISDYSNFDKTKLKLLNPKKINLEHYEKKIIQQISIFNKFLIDKLWKLLPDREKEILNLKEITSINSNNRYLIKDSLKHSNWPISKEDFEEIEKKIDLANSYLELSKNLTNYLNREYHIDPLQRDLNQIVEKIDIPKPLEIENIKNFEKEMSSETKKEDKLSRGDKVIARNDLLGYYYSGKISKVMDSRHVNVKFENGPKQADMSIRNIIKLPNITPYLSLGDYVMASVINEFEQNCWVPGIVQSIDQISYTKLFTVLYFNGQEGENTRQELYKINRNTYGFIVNYIRSRLGINTSLKPHHEEKKIQAPNPGPPSPDLDQLKEEIVDSIKIHFNSLKLDQKYQKMYNELLNLRKKNKDLKSDLEGKLKVLKKDFDDWKSQEPPIILPDPNIYIYQSDTKEYKKSRTKKKDKDKLEVENRELKKEFETRKNSDLVINKPSNSSLIQTELTVEQKLKLLAQDLPELREGEEVLARWPDDGWYYRSIVKKRLNENKYELEDSLKDTEIVNREDIISEINDSESIFEVGDPVVALHPHYEFSYAPGQIVQISNDFNKLLIRFYDFVEHVIFREEVYKLPRIKFQLDIDSIIELEKRWIGQTVVARNNYSNVYELGKIITRVGNGRQYTIEWSNGDQSIQNANHIFGIYTRNPSIIVNDYILAPKETIYLPGRVIGKKGNQLRVKFVDGVIDESINTDDCYWLSRDYYDDCCWFYKKESDSVENKNVNEKHKDRDRLTETETTPKSMSIIDASDYHSGKSNKIKYNQSNAE